jgi:hypothetical protein
MFASSSALAAHDHSSPSSHSSHSLPASPHSRPSSTSSRPHPHPSASCLRHTQLCRASRASRTEQVTLAARAVGCVPVDWPARHVPSRHTAACPLPASIPRLPAHHEPPARPRLYLCVFFCFYSRSRFCFGSRPTGKRHCSMHALRPARNAQRPHGLQKRSAGLSTPTHHAYISLSSAPGLHPLGEKRRLPTMHPLLAQTMRPPSTWSW